MTFLVWGNSCNLQTGDDGVKVLILVLEWKMDYVLMFAVDVLGSVYVLIWCPYISEALTQVKNDKAWPLSPIAQKWIQII